MKTGSSLDVAYLDPSALVKLVLDEAESDAVRRALRFWPQRATSKLSIVEVLRTVRRRHDAAEPLARAMLSRVALLSIGDRELAASVVLGPPSLRAADAIHLASALRLRRTLGAFVSYDVRQLEAASALGLPVVSPS